MTMEDATILVKYDEERSFEFAASNQEVRRLALSFVPL